MTLSEVAQATGMTRATVRRFLLTLVREGYVETNGKHFNLRPKILELGFSALSSMDIWDVAQPIMNALSERLQESCFAAVLDHDSVIYVARATSNQRVSVGINIGSRVPAHCVSTGRVLLSALPPDLLHQYLDEMTLTKFTPNTITSKVQLRGLIDEVRASGLVDRRPGTGGRFALAFGADPRRAGQDRRRPQCLLPEHAHHARRHAHPCAGGSAGSLQQHHPRLADLSWADFEHLSTLVLQVPLHPIPPAPR